MDEATKVFFFFENRSGQSTSGQLEVFGPGAFGEGKREGERLKQEESTLFFCRNILRVL